jgi:two-component system, chemotaxis family, CheB/CheR fusion protein
MRKGTNVKTDKEKTGGMGSSKKRPKFSRAGNSIPPLENKQRNFLIVGIGASAGGLKAFEHFFSKMTPDSGMAFILIPHLDPSHVSMLPELLRKYTEMAVLEANDGTKVESNTIYIIPRNKKMAIKHGALVLTEPTEPRGLRLPIDTFFRSLAEDQRSDAIGVILSGTGTDGTMGLKAIKDAGGLVIAQNLASAEFDGMPRSAIETGLVDYVLAPEKIAEQLLNYAKGSRPQRRGATTTLSDKSPGTLEEICHVLRSQTGHDFSAYKKSTIGRRIARRMSIHQIENPSDYLRLLEQNAQEAAALCKDLLIGVTDFFRDPEAFKVLSRVLKGMLAKKPKDYTVRVWVPGCSSGDEVYSIGIILRECMDALKKHFNVQIFGTDIDTDAIETARAGIYPANIVKDVAPARLTRFFLDQSDGYHIKKEIREMAIFSIQDLIKDPPFTKLDLLSCRNVFIYLDSELQKRLLRLFHYALRRDGILFLGASETIGGYVDLFAERNKRWKIFKRRDSKQVIGANLPFPLEPSRREPEIGPRAQSKEGHETWISGVAEKLLLDRYVPPCVLINKSGNILYTHGATSRYLGLPQGQASLNILAMARGRLKSALATLMRKAGMQKQPASLEGVRLRSDDKYHRLNLTATRYPGGHGAGELLLIVFEDAGSGKVKTRKRGRSAPSRDARRVARLEQELWDAREQLQLVMAEKQSPDEELRSYNEELQSANEELQSVNEELETSKEELQSLNEELATVNAELQGKNEELSSANDDMRNLLDSTKIATLFLDTRLCVKRFTPEVTKVINLVQGDVGRPVGHFKTKFVDDNVAQKAQEVMDTLLPTENEISSTDGQWYLKRITPYRATNNVIGGVVVTFIDITERKRLELAAEETRKFAQDIVETVREPLVVLDSDLNVVSANTSFYRRFNLTPQLAERRSLFELNNRQWDIPELRRLLEKVLPENHSFGDFTVELDSPDLGHPILLLNARRIHRGDIGTALILLALEDVSDRERKEELRALAARLHAVREEERTQLAREIHDELSGSLTALKMVVSLLPDRALKDHKSFLEQLTSMSQLIDHTLAQVRTIVTELRPVVLDKLGLMPAIEWQAREFQERSGIACETHLPAEEISLDSDRATAVFRIFQEALTNIARHANASKVVVDLKREAESLILAVRDNGKGIDEAAIHAPTSLGLLGIRERALSFGGTAEVTALPEQGTCVTVRVPINK